MTKILSLALAMLGFSVVPAIALEVSATAMVPGKPKEVWNKIGSFCSIKDWHPVVAKCQKSKDGGATFRTLTTKDGGTIKEKLLKKTDHSYTYEIIESPLPVQNYKATISVAADGDQTKVEWKGTFDAKGASDDDAKKVVSGIYQAGLDNLAKPASN
jgi:Polyketide cyclase / dehydrase and lipid transport